MSPHTAHSWLGDGGVGPGRGASPGLLEAEEDTEVGAVTEASRGLGDSLLLQTKHYHQSSQLQYCIHIDDQPPQVNKSHSFFGYDYGISNIKQQTKSSTKNDVKNPSLYVAYDSILYFDG